MDQQLQRTQRASDVTRTRSANGQSANAMAAILRIESMTSYQKMEIRLC